MDKVQEILIWIYDLFGQWWLPIFLGAIAFVMVGGGIALLITATIIISVMIGQAEAKFSVSEALKKFKLHVLDWWERRPSIRDSK